MILFFKNITLDVYCGILKNEFDNIVKLEYNMTIKTEVTFYVCIRGNNTPIC